MMFNDNNCPRCKKKWSASYGNDRKYQKSNFNNCKIIYWQATKEIEWQIKEEAIYLYWQLELGRCTYFNFSRSINETILPILPFDITLKQLKLYLTLL
jgi:hypothetical protein